MKTITLLLFINSFCFSAELLTYTSYDFTKSHCIDDYYIQNGKLLYKKSGKNFYNTLSTYYAWDIKSGYKFENNKCSLNDNSLSFYTFDSNSKPIYKNLTELGLSVNDFNFMMAFSGILISFLFLFGLFRWI